MALLVISYAREDQPQVRAIVALLQAAFRDIDEAVYWDDRFEPGDPWFDQLKAYIDKTPQLFVFWCAHSAGSKQVRREYKYAESVGKRIVPVLLDDTKLVGPLAPIHGIDLRKALRHRRPSRGRVGPVARSIIRTSTALMSVLGLAVLFGPSLGSESLTGSSALIVFAVVYWLVGRLLSPPPEPIRADFDRVDDILDYEYCDAIVEMFGKEMQLTPERSRL